MDTPDETSGLSKDGSSDATSSPTSAFQEARRLHPLTLVQRLLISIPGFIFLLLPLFRNPGQSTLFSLAIAALYGVIAIPLLVLQYLRFRYYVTDRELVIESGVLNRQHRSIPIERIQNMEIEQGLLPRMFGTAKVKVETAGSTNTEGVLEFVSLEEARSLRRMVRQFQRQQSKEHTPDSETPNDQADANGQASSEEQADETASDETRGVLLFSMPLRRVVLSGMYRFSLVYIALIFGGLQYLDIQPEAIVDWFILGQHRAYTSVFEELPGWVLILIGVVTAALLSWVTGIAINVNKYYRFRLWKEDDKVHRTHGLLTLTDKTLPLRKVQALILRTNPLMRRFDWRMLQVQTMGLDVEQQGYQVAVPFAKLDEALRVGAELYPFSLPPSFQRVSKLTIRRATIRYTMGLLALLGPLTYFYPVAAWGFLVWPLLVGFAYLQYLNHGYSVTDDTLFVRRGVLRQYTWVLPVQRFQVFYNTASLFQRRLNLKSVLVDTAGMGTFAVPEIVDLPAETADALTDQLDALFRHRGAGRPSDLRVEAINLPDDTASSAEQQEAATSVRHHPGWPPAPRIHPAAPHTGPDTTPPE